MLKRAVQDRVLELFGPGDGERPIASGPFVDAGLFGPDAVCWRVHGDLGVMLAGGIAALLLQMLHPRALAGVWDHSDFRTDRLGRLRRTARYVSALTYGSRAEATAQIERVKRIHDRVHGQTADGDPYSANDPDLLTWVHVAESISFLDAYLIYGAKRLSRTDQDRYFAETALGAEMLGARGVPKSGAATRDWLEARRPELRYDHRTREAAKVLLTTDDLKPAVASATRLIFAAAKDLLPPWAATMHGFRPALIPRPAVRLTMQNLSAGLRWALPNGVETRARRRAAEASLGDLGPGGPGLGDSA
ncbi:MAG TPA: oxygenase MpaB family protein [Caulobacteraceae bacterium]|jgi:uncharacterized protein (DUF2236 family)|nr:oxygenase MpaB family protein [Caulobacteraceae bacterium]